MSDLLYQHAINISISKYLLSQLIYQATCHLQNQRPSARSDSPLVPHH